MILLTQPALEDLVQNHAGLTPNRRRFLVDMLCDMTIEDRESYLESYAEFTPAEELVFIRACFGETTLTQNHHAPIRS